MTSAEGIQSLHFEKMLYSIGIYGETRKFVGTIMSTKFHCIAYTKIVFITSVAVNSESCIVTHNVLYFVRSEGRHQKCVLNLSQGVIADTAAKYIQWHY